MSWEEISWLLFMENLWCSGWRRRRRGAFQGGGGFLTGLAVEAAQPLVGVLLVLHTLRLMLPKSGVSVDAGGPLRCRGLCCVADEPREERHHLRGGGKKEVKASWAFWSLQQASPPSKDVFIRGLVWRINVLICSIWSAHLLQEGRAAGRISRQVSHHATGRQQPVPVSNATPFMRWIITGLYRWGTGKNTANTLACPPPPGPGVCSHAFHRVNVRRLHSLANNALYCPFFKWPTFLKPGSLNAGTCDTTARHLKRNVTPPWVNRSHRSGGFVFSWASTTPHPSPQGQEIKGKNDKKQEGLRRFRWKKAAAESSAVEGRHAAPFPVFLLTSEFPEALRGRHAGADGRQSAHNHTI